MSTSAEDDDDILPIERLQQQCKQIATETMLRVMNLCAGDETECQYAMCVVIKQMHEHLGLSLAGRKTREDFLKGIER